MGSSWEDIANEVVPDEMDVRGLAAGPLRGPARPYRGAPLDGRRASPPADPRVIPCPPCTRDAALDEVLRGGEVQGSRSTYYFMSHPAASYDAEFATLPDSLGQVLRREQHPALAEKQVKDLLFVDIETTGLSSTSPLFLIGALRLDGEPRLDLFLARNHREEAAVLAAFHELAHGKVLVTYNGKAFDWPYIAGRSQYHCVRCPRPRAHFDLLHHARKAWKHELPNCKLQTLELYMCGRTRLDDIPSWRIPERYGEFLELYSLSGRGAHLLAPVVHHNALDILTMAQLLTMKT